MENKEVRTDIIECIDNRLRILDLGDFKSQNDRIREYLYNIEMYIQVGNKKRDELLKEYKKLKFNVKSVANESSISRQTIYNNKKILETYINDAVREQEKNDILNDIKVLNEKKQELEEIIFKMQVRDLKIEKLQNEIDEQEKTIINKDKTIESLEIRNRELNVKITELERNITNVKILQFKK